jgi:hypothetical protein
MTFAGAVLPKQVVVYLKLVREACRMRRHPETHGSLLHFLFWVQYALAGVEGVPRIVQDHENTKTFVNPLSPALVKRPIDFAG